MALLLFQVCLAQFVTLYFYENMFTVVYGLGYMCPMVMALIFAQDSMTGFDKILFQMSWVF